jgi:hypothetical protein
MLREDSDLKTKSIVLTKDSIEALETISKKEHRKFSEQVRYILDQYLKLQQNNEAI